MSAAIPFTKESHGAHTDIFKFNDNVLKIFSKKNYIADDKTILLKQLSESILVKKGKIKDFTMPLTRSGNNTIPRKLMSYAFGPFGVNIAPVFSKVMEDSNEVARQIPYFAYGEPSSFLLPDYVSMLSNELSRQNNKVKNPFLTVFFDNQIEQYSLFDIIKRDPYFNAKIKDSQDLIQYQQFIRKNPLSLAMKEKLTEFFESPITVGVRDVLRRMKGAKHPHLSWEQAFKAIDYCFEKWGTTNFLVPEVNYYSYDTSIPSKNLSELIKSNQQTARLLTSLLKELLPETVYWKYIKSGGDTVSYQILRFYHDYPLYEVEPYTGVLSTTTAYMMLRIFFSVFLLLSGKELQEPGNTDFSKIPEYSKEAIRFFASLSKAETEITTDALIEIFLKYMLQNGFKLNTGKRFVFKRIPKTFYNFQRLATGQKNNPDIEFFITTEQFQKNKFALTEQKNPEIAEKLVVFYTLVYRFFLDTGFIPDLRPKHAGRDIFIYGIWGYITENLLILKNKTDIEIKFIDNRDNFKRYEPSIDSRKPVGFAKLGWRLAFPLIEPALQRSIGIYTKKIHDRLFENQDKQTNKSIVEFFDFTLDVTRKIVTDIINYSLITTEAFAVDLVNDIYKGTKKVFGLIRKLI